MFDDLAFNRSCTCAALAAVVLLAGCGGNDDDTSTQSQSATTTPAATSPSTSAAPAPAPGSPSAAAKPAAKDCPVTAQEISQQLGIKLSAAPPVLRTKMSCAFSPTTGCPCGSAKYSEVGVTIAAGLPRTVQAQRVGFKGAAGSKLIDRPEFGKHAFVLQMAEERGRSATFPSSDGTAIVVIALGLRDKSNRAHVARDARLSNRVIALVAQRMT